MNHHSRPGLAIAVASALAGALVTPAGAQTTIKRESVTLFADAACMVKIREAKSAQLGPLQELSRASGCVQLRDAQGKVFFVMEASLSARGPAVACKPRPGGAPVATDMAGVSAGGTRICP